MFMSWSSLTLYSDQLTAAPSVSNHLLSGLPKVFSTEITNTVLLLMDTAGCSMQEMTTKDQISKANEGEAALVCHHVKCLVEQGVDVEDIAVVTPYNLQVELLMPSFPQLEIQSVDGYQVRFSPTENVAVIRARIHLDMV